MVASADGFNTGRADRRVLAAPAVAPAIVVEGAPRYGFIPRRALSRTPSRAADDERVLVTQDVPSRVREPLARSCRGAARWSSRRQATS